MTKELKNRILENKILTHDERMEIIKALEQQPSDDCVSRQAMLEYQQYLHGKMPNEENYKLWKFIKDLPPVTPTHGTCKDCRYNVKDGRTTTMCDIGHRFYMREPSTFYCADYEKRGNEE